MSLIIGIDPGSNIIGYGILKNKNNKFNYLTSGLIVLKNKDFFMKLKYIYNEMNKIINIFNPKYSVIEKTFIGKNVKTSIKLCQARSIIILSLINYNIPIFEYTFNQVRKYVLNIKHSNKLYTKIFIKNKFNLYKLPNSDEADALAIAITHHYYTKYIRI